MYYILKTIWGDYIATTTHPYKSDGHGYPRAETIEEVKELLMGAGCPATQINTDFIYYLVDGD